MFLNLHYRSDGGGQLTVSSVSPDDGSVAFACWFGQELFDRGPFLSGLSKGLFELADVAEPLLLTCLGQTGRDVGLDRAEATELFGLDLLERTPQTGFSELRSQGVGREHPTARLRRSRGRCRTPAGLASHRQ